MSSVIDILPGWLIAVLLFAVLTAAALLGNLLRGRRFSGEAHYATAAAVSLLVLLIGFTFSLALNRYDTRRDLAVEEAAAIWGTWERAQLEPPATRTALAGLMRDYAAQRLRYFTFGIDLDHQLRADAEADATMARAWVVVRERMLTGQHPAATRSLLDSVGRIDDAAWRREAMAREHIPFLVVDLLVIFSLLTAFSMGVSAPLDRRPHPTHLIFFALNSAAIMLVLDLDRPRSGLVLVSQRPMLEVQAMMAERALLPRPEQRGEQP